MGSSHRYLTERFRCQTGRSISVWHLSRCRVALRPAVLSAARIWPSVSRYLEISFGLRGPSPQAFTPSRGGHCPAPEVPLTRGMPTGPRAFLANSGRVWATAVRPVPPKKGLVPYMPVRRGVHQIPQITIGLNLSSCRVALRPAVLSAARIWPSVSGYLEISFGLRAPPGFYSLRGWGIHRPAPVAPLIRGIPTGPKNALCHTRPFGRASNKYRRSISVLSEQFETSYLFYITLSFLYNIICYLISVFAFSLVTLFGATTTRKSGKHFVRHTETLDSGLN